MTNRRKKRIFGTTEKPRLVVFRSLKYIHAQLVDDEQQKVIMGMFDNSKICKEAVKKAKNKTEAASIIGKILAEEATKKNIKKIIFDRNGYIYHGRIKALADGAREGGLDF